MPVLISKDNKELIISCNCGCENALHISIEGEEDTFSFLSYMNGNFYREQESIKHSFKSKIKKIIAIIRNKDYYYSDIVMTLDDWETFKEWVNKQVI